MTVANDHELLKSVLELLAAIISGIATIAGAIIVGIFGTLIAQRYSREKDRQDKESQWRNHAIELTKLEVERKLKRFEKDPSIPLRPSILDFLANYRDLTELDRVSPKDLYRKILDGRITQIGQDKADQEEKS